MAEEQPDAATPEEEIDAQPSASEPAAPSTPIQTQAPAAPTPAPAQAQAPQPAAQPAQQAPDHGNIFKSILGVLGGGDKTQYSVDPQTGTMSVSKVPQTKGQLARGILAGALTGLVAGAGEHGPGNEGRALAAGNQAVTQQRQQADAQQKQLAQQNYDQQQKAIVQKAQVFEANSRAALNTQQAEKLGDERMDSYIDYMKPMVTAAAAEGRVIAGQDQPITQQEALDGMKSGKYNPAEVMWTPTARAPRVGADGKDNGSELVGVLVKDGMMDLRKPEVNKGNAVKYGFIPENATQMKTSMYNQIMQKTQMVDNAKDEMTKVHQQLGTAADGMPDFDSIIKTPGMADALQKFQGYVGAAKGFDPANAINAMSQEKMNPKTGQPVSNPDAKYVPLIYKAFGGQDVIKKYEDTLTADKNKVAADEAGAKSTAEAKAKLAVEGSPTALNLARKKAEISEQAKQSSNDNDISQAAKNIIGGDVSTLMDISSYKMGERTKLFNAIHAEAVAQGKDPKDYSPEKLKAKGKVLNDFADGKAADSLVTFNTFLGHTNDALSANDNWRRANSPLINKPLSWLATNATNDPNFQTFQTSLIPVRKEFMSFLNANRAEHEDDIKEMHTVLDDNKSPAQIEVSLKKLGQSADIRMAELANKYKNTMGTSYPNLMSNNAKSALQRMGIQSQVEGGGGVAPEGTMVKVGNQTKVKRGGQWVDQ